MQHNLCSISYAKNPLKTFDPILERSCLYKRTCVTLNQTVIGLSIVMRPTISHCIDNKLNRTHHINSFTLIYIGYFAAKHWNLNFDYYLAHTVSTRVLAVRIYIIYRPSHTKI